MHLTPKTCYRKIKKAASNSEQLQGLCPDPDNILLIIWEAKNGKLCISHLQRTEMFTTSLKYMPNNSAAKGLLQKFV